MSWYLAVLRKYAVFEGRARRKEYWMFTLFNIIFSLALYIIEFILGFDHWFWLSIIYALGMVIPELAVTVRRLHDTGHTGWWVFINLVPFVGAIILLVFMCTDSQSGNNQYGPNPKETMTGINGMPMASY